MFVIFFHLFLNLTLFVHQLLTQTFKTQLCDMPLGKVDEGKDKYDKMFTSQSLLSIIRMCYSNLCCFPCQFYYLMLEVLI